MRIPQVPPDWQQVIGDLVKRPEALAFVMEAVPGPTYLGRYVHWEKLKYLPRPAGATAEQVWATLKLRRSSMSNAVPFYDKQGRRISFALPDLAIEYLHKLDLDAGGTQLINDNVLTPGNRERYVVRSLMEEAITSSQLEGAATTRVVAKEMLRSGRKPRDKHERMIANNYEAMKKIQSLKAVSLTPEIIVDLQRTLTTNAIDVPDGVGRLRRPDEHVVVETPDGEILHSPPPAAELPDRLQALCDFANKKTPQGFLHPVVRAITLHFMLAYDHPFADGNGRCARALFYWSMLSSGYWLCEFLSISQVIRQHQSAYGRAFLYTETDGNDLTYFVLYHLDVVHRAMEELANYVKAKTTEIRRTEQLLKGSDNFNYRQVELLGRALRDPDAAFTVAEHQASHGIVYETARRDLGELEQKGFLSQYKRGKAFVYRAIPNLAERMDRFGK